jgi:hypothetical protein
MKKLFESHLLQYKEHTIKDRWAAMVFYKP